MTIHITQLLQKVSYKIPDIILWEIYGIFQLFTQSSKLVSILRKKKKKSQNHKILDLCNSREECQKEVCPDKSVVQIMFNMIDEGETSGKKPQIQ